MANDIDLWHDIELQEGFIKWLKTKDVSHADTLKRGKEDLKKMLLEYSRLYIAF